MKKTKLNSVLRKTSSKVSKSVHGDRSAHKKVTFNEKVDTQWPEASDRIRLEASLAIAKRVAEREQKILAILNRDEERNKGNSGKDPNHPNFPFPENYKRIDFEHLDPYKLYQAAEFLRQERERFVQPFQEHYEKIQAFEHKAEEIIQEEEAKLSQTMNLIASKSKKSKTQPKQTVYKPSISPYKINRLKRVDSKSKYSKSTLLFAKMNNPGGKVITKPGYLPKPPDTLIPPQPRTDVLAMKNVAYWVKSNFQIKPVPLLLRTPRLVTSESVLAPHASIATGASIMSTTLNEIYHHNHVQIRQNDEKELHLVNGIIRPPNAFTETVGNSFDENYAASPFSGTLGNPLFWIPHHYRFVVDMSGFKDNEITIFYKRPFIIIKGKSPQTRKRTMRKAEESFEIPDSVQIKNLKFYRITDGKIVIEEAPHKKKPPNVPHVPEAAMIALKNYYHEGSII